MNRCVRICAIALPAVLFTSGLCFAITPLTFEDHNTDIPVTIDGHALVSPWGYGTPSASYPTFGDIDGDDDLDLFIGTGEGTLIFYKNTGTKQTPSFTLESRKFLGIDKDQYLLFPTLADTDNDSDLDLYFGDWAEGINYYKNKGNSRVHELVSGSGSEATVDVKNFAAPTFGDLDEDEDLDLLVGNFEGRVFYYENVGTLSKPQYILTDNTFLDIEVEEVAVPKLVDIDADKDMDLFLGNSQGVIQFYRNNGTARKMMFELENASYITIDPAYTYPAFGDIDADGDYDLFIGTNKGATIYFKNTGTAQEPLFEKVTDEYFHIKVGENAALDFADIDDDGDEDMFILNKTGEFDYFRNTGSAATPHYTLAARDFARLDTYASSFRIADIDSDNDFDLIVGYYDSQTGKNGGHLSLYRNIGSVRTPNFLKIENAFPQIDVGEASTPELYDYDNDGDMDLFIGNAEGKIAYYENTGTKEIYAFTLVNQTFENINVDAHAQIRFADLDNDGDEDAVLGNKYGRVLYFENVTGNVNVNFLNRGEITPDLGDFSVIAPLDINFDKKMDLFVSSAAGNVHHFSQVSTNLFPPEDIAGVKVVMNEHRITTITWKDSLDSEKDLSHYQVYQRIDDEGFGGGANVGKGKSVTIVELRENHPYTVKIIAIDSSNLESKGVVVTLTRTGEELDYEITYPKKEIIVAPGSPVTEYCAGFTDVLKSEVGSSMCDAVSFVKDAGIFTGNSDGTLALSRPINRAEVTKVLLEAFDYTIEESLEPGLTFTDIEPAEWYAPYVYTALKHEIVTGYGDKTFKPGQTTNKVELLKLLLEMANVDLSTVDIGTSLYSDIEASAENEWFIAYTNFAHLNSLIEVTNNSLLPATPMTRGDVILLLYRMKERVPHVFPSSDPVL